MKIFSIAILGALLLATAARGAVIYQSATLGATGQVTGSVVSGGSFAQFLGARFSVTQTEEVTDIGGQLGDTSGTLFGAIISLSSPSALPPGSPYNGPEVVADTTFNPGTPSSDFLTPLSATLTPGEYAIIFGSGEFSASGTGFMPTDNTDLAGASFVTWDGFTSTWQDSDATGLRFVVTGTAVPEPSSFTLAALVVAAVAVLSFRGKGINCQSGDAT